MWFSLSYVIYVCILFLGKGVMEVTPKLLFFFHFHYCVFIIISYLFRRLLTLIHCCSLKIS